MGMMKAERRKKERIRKKGMKEEGTEGKKKERRTKASNMEASSFSHQAPTMRFCKIPYGVIENYCTYPPISGLLLRVCITYNSLCGHIDRTT